MDFAMSILNDNIEDFWMKYKKDKWKILLGKRAKKKAKKIQKKQAGVFEDLREIEMNWPWLQETKGNGLKTSNYGTNSSVLLALFKAWNSRSEWSFMTWQHCLILENIEYYHNMQYRVDPTNQTPENGQNPDFWLFGSSKKAFLWFLNDPAWAIWEPTCQDHLV